jgi:hypothetical protein
VHRDAGSHRARRFLCAWILAFAAGAAGFLAGPLAARADDASAENHPGALFPNQPTPPHSNPGWSTTPANGIALPALSEGASDPRFGAMPEPDRHGEYYFYRGYSYGSASLNNPARMILNGGYGIMQVAGHDNHVFNTDYRNGIDNLWKNVSEPWLAIANEGPGRFLREEVIPISTSTESARYWPNYTQHLIGGGMSYRLTQEWYRAHSYEHPGWWAVGSMAVYHVLNETVETADYTGWTTDPVADLLIFDPAGILLFSSDRVSRFFGRTLHMNDWSYQPCYDPVDKTIENIGQNYVMKLRLPAARRWFLFYHYGTHGELGLSYWRDDGTCFSAGGGFMAGQLREIGDGVRTVDLVPSAGIFWDRHNSLMASFLFANTQAYRWRLNVYPGVVKIGGWSPGFFTAINRDDNLETGITITGRIPVGFATEFHR